MTNIYILFQIQSNQSMFTAIKYFIDTASWLLSEKA